MEQIPITPRQLEFLDAISRMIKESGGVCPTHDELAKEMNVSVNAAITMVQRLVRRGHLQKPARMHRAMRVVNHGRASA